EYPTLTSEELNGNLEASAEAFKHWKTTPLIERTDLLKKAGQILRDNLDEYAEIITLEMGKPISESKSEVNKCAWVCDYYSEHAEEF
ncbi:aldehyde dehydrogenase family protein, partial [Aquimarina celericrescens]|nr:aldehyde dehydrogenase family protein [Aquimarina celericrescens]